MNRNSGILGWVLVAALVMLWTGYKSRQAQEQIQQEKEKAAADSIQSLERLKEKAKRKDSIIAEYEKRLAAGDSVQPPAWVSREIDQPMAEPDTIPSGEDTDSIEPGAPRKPAARANQFSVETPKVTFGLSTAGGAMTEIYLKDEIGYHPSERQLLPDTNGPVLDFAFGKQKLSETVCQSSFEGDTLKVLDQPQTVTFTCAGLRGLPPITRTYRFHPDSTRFTHNLDAGGYKDEISLLWPGGLNETEELQGTGGGFTNYYFSEFILNTGTTVLRETFDETEIFNKTGSIKWAGLRRKYVAGIVNFNQDVTHEIIVTEITDPRDEKYPRTYSLEFESEFYEPGTFDFDFVVLPLFYEKIETYEQNYHKILFSGWSFIGADVWYVWLCGTILKLLNVFFSWIPNYGIAIIMLTLLVRLITLPLTLHQTKMSVKMQQHAPAIKALREKYKDNPQRFQQEMMAYYRKVGVNPMAQMAGCFPMLLQMPIFIALFNVLGRALELKEAGFMLWIQDLSEPDVILEALKIPYIFPQGLTVLPILFALSMFGLMKMTIKDPQQRFMVWFMPIFMFFICASVPSGLVLYWTVSNLFSMGQTWVFMKKGISPSSQQNPAAAGGAIKGGSKKVR